MHAARIRPRIFSWSVAASIALIALTCARAPAGEVQEAPDANQLLRAACAGALASLDPDRAEAEHPTALLPVALEPTLRALHGTGMGGRVDALDVALERAARLALREEQAWLESAVASFAPATPPADSDAASSVAFRTAHEAELRARLALTAGPALEGSGARDALESVRAGATQLPLRRAVELDLVSIVTERALTRFFGALAEQEKTLRQQRETLRGGYGGPPNSGPLPGPEAKGGSR
jgi:hypothetical protein